MRDLKADLRLCEGLSPGPWGNGVIHEKAVVMNPKGKSIPDSGADALFITEAREGWPEAIRRAMDAEADLAFLQEAYGDSDEPMTKDALELKARCKVLKERDELRAVLKEMTDAVDRAISRSGKLPSMGDWLALIGKARQVLEE